jgi:hypothetical protein
MGRIIADRPALSRAAATHPCARSRGCTATGRATMCDLAQIGRPAMPAAVPAHARAAGRPIGACAFQPKNRNDWSLGPGAVAHHADGVELGLLAGFFLSPLACLVALVEQLDLLELLERFAEVRLRLVELPAELGH